jgi:hypothetical protein
VTELVGKAALVGKGSLEADTVLHSYATIAEAQALTAGNSEFVQRVDAERWGPALERASRDVEGYLAWPVPVADTLRIDIDMLTAYQRGALARATIEQASYRLARSEAEMVVDSYRHGLRGETTIIAPPAPRIGQQAQEALAEAGLFRWTGTAPPPSDPPDLP